MSGADDFSWNRFGTYLRFLAESRLSPHLKPHVDLSGIVQQTLLEAHEALRLGSVVITLPYLRQVLSNNLADEIRRLHADKRDVRREMSLQQSVEQSSMRLEALLEDNSPSPADNVLRQEQVLRLTEAMQRLPESQREALVLQAWQGWSLAEISTHMGRTKQAVAGLLKRGLQQLRQEMDQAPDSDIRHDK